MPTHVLFTLKLKTEHMLHTDTHAAVLSIHNNLCIRSARVAYSQLTLFSSEEGTKHSAGDLRLVLSH